MKIKHLPVYAFGRHCAWFAIQGSDPCARSDLGHHIRNDSRDRARRPLLVNHFGDSDTRDRRSARLSRWNRDTRHSRMSDPRLHAQAAQCLGHRKAIGIVSTLRALLHQP
jgi:hypothetical protein